MQAKWLFSKKFKKKPLGYIRHGVQLAFLLFILYVGIQFFRFYLHFSSMGEMPYVDRPSSVEGFLPISALVALKVWVTTGEFDIIHPAGLLLLTFLLISGLLFRRIFCSWMCPVGTVSEWIGMLGKKIFGKNYDIPRWITWILYPLKYLLLFFFAKMIIFNMPVEAAKAFLYSPYNQISDVKMLKFFLEISTFSFRVIVVLIFLSIFFKNFWCRFLCPYGALIGLSSLFNLTRITRDKNTCISCNQCTRVCPQRIKVSEKKAVLTPECTSCMQCVEACPVKDTLTMKVGPKKVNKWVIPVAFFSSFFLMFIVAKLTGHWDTVLTYEDFKVLIPWESYIGH